MPVREREAFSLTFYHNWSTPQIAELFQVDDRTIRRWYEAACEHLRQAMGTENPLA
jgi:DNA-directed RNA polymerase specialized sigma24 family protein